ncbi:helix-turn-helix domain-containing protein, partial [Streptomyces luteocolor]
MNGTSQPWSTCQYCGTPFEIKQRGRRASFCGQACRQADYRKRERAKKSGESSANGPPHPLSDLHEELRELVLDGQEEMRHLVRLLAGDDVAAWELVDIANQLRERMEAVTAGLITRARATGTPWKLLGTILHMSPETARRVYHERRAEQQLARYITHCPPTVPPAAEPPAAADDEEDTVPQTPALPRQRSANRLAPVLSQLQRVSGIPLRQLGLRVKCSASYLSRVLSGERFPTWSLTEKLGSALGADAQVLREVWNSEHVRQNTPADDNDLHTALRTMHSLAGRPTLRDLVAASNGLLSPHTISTLLEGSHSTDWIDVERLVRILDGEPAYFRPLWERHQ